MNENVRPIGGPTASSMHLTDQDWIVRKLWFMFNPLDKSKVFPPLDIGVAASLAKDWDKSPIDYKMKAFDFIKKTYGKTGLFDFANKVEPGWQEHKINLARPEQSTTDLYHKPALQHAEPAHGDLHGLDNPSFEDQGSNASTHKLADLLDIS